MTGYTSSITSPFTLRPSPSWWMVLKEQFRSVGIAIRQVVLIAGALLLTLSIISVVNAFHNAEPTSISPDLIPLTTFIALFFALAVWRADYRFPNSYLAAMPVNRTRHALTKVAAGWAWLMILVTVFLAWMLALAAITGGHIGIDEMRLFVQEPPQSKLLAEVATLSRRWVTPPWQWAVFFTSTTAAYLLGSALVLASSRTRRTVGGLAVLCVFLIIAADNGVLYLGPVMPWFEAAIVGPYGVMTLITGYDGRFATLTTEGGTDITVWSALPGLKASVITVMIWLSLGLACVASVIHYDRSS